MRIVGVCGLEACYVSPRDAGYWSENGNWWRSKSTRWSSIIIIMVTKPAGAKAGGGWSCRRRRQARRVEKWPSQLGGGSSWAGGPWGSGGSSPNSFLSGHRHLVGRHPAPPGAKVQGFLRIRHPPRRERQQRRFFTVDLWHSRNTKKILIWLPQENLRSTAELGFFKHLSARLHNLMTGRMAVAKPTLPLYPPSRELSKPPFRRASMIRKRAFCRIKLHVIPRLKEKEMPKWIRRSASCLTGLKNPDAFGNTAKPSFDEFKRSIPEEYDEYKDMITFTGGQEDWEGRENRTPDGRHTPGFAWREVKESLRKKLFEDGVFDKLPHGGTLSMWCHSKKMKEWFPKLDRLKVDVANAGIMVAKARLLFTIGADGKPTIGADGKPTGELVFLNEYGQPIDAELNDGESFEGPTHLEKEGQQDDARYWRMVEIAKILGVRPNDRGHAQKMGVFMNIDRDAEEGGQNGHAQNMRGRRCFPSRREDPLLFPGSRHVDAPVSWRPNEHENFKFDFSNCFWRKTFMLNLNNFSLFNCFRNFFGVNMMLLFNIHMLNSIKLTFSKFLWRKTLCQIKFKFQQQKNKSCSYEPQQFSLLNWISLLNNKIQYKFKIIIQIV